MLVIAVVVALPRLFDWDGGALGPTQEWHRVLASFAILLLRHVVAGQLSTSCIWIGRRQSKQRDRAAATERARIARELHDVVAHQMTVVVAQAQGAEALVASDPDRARTALGTISETTRNALVEMRRLRRRATSRRCPLTSTSTSPARIGVRGYARLAEGAEAAGLRDVPSGSTARGQPTPRWASRCPPTG